MTEKTNTLFAALLAAQKEIGKVTRDAKNPHFKSNYSTLEAVIESVKEPLNNNGLIITQTLEQTDGGDWCLATRLTHSESREAITSSMPIVAKDMSDPQKWGSAITYARRYTLQALVVLPAEDDDGNKAAADKSDKYEAQYKEREKKQLARMDDELKAAKEAFAKCYRSAGVSDGAAMKMVADVTDTAAKDCSKEQFEWLLHLFPFWQAYTARGVSDGAAADFCEQKLRKTLKDCTEQDFEKLTAMIIVAQPETRGDES